MARLRSRARTKIWPIDERPKCSGAVGIVPSLVARRQAASAFDSRKAQAASGSQPNAARKRADRRGLDSVLYTRSPYVFPMGDFKELKAWQYARKLAVLSKDTIARLPESERDALADQWRRAAYSVALNIPEGASRRGVKDFRKHLDIARASLHEVEAILDLVIAQGYVRPGRARPRAGHARRVRENGIRSASNTAGRTEATRSLNLTAYGLRLFAVAGSC